MIFEIGTWFLFNLISLVDEKNQIEFNREEFEKWGLYCSAIEFYDDAMHTRDFVLKRNTLLAIRALIGPNLRSEILFRLLGKSRIHIRLLAESIGYAYSAVYREVTQMVANGFLLVEVYGRIKVLSMSGMMHRYLKRIPV